MVPQKLRRVSKLTKSTIAEFVLFSFMGFYKHATRFLDPIKGDYTTLKENGQIRELLILTILKTRLNFFWGQNVQILFIIGKIRRTYIRSPMQN